MRLLARPQRACVRTELNAASCRHLATDWLPAQRQRNSCASISETGNVACVPGDGVTTRLSTSPSVSRSHRRYPLPAGSAGRDYLECFGRHPARAAWRHARSGAHQRLVLYSPGSGVGLDGRSERSCAGAWLALPYRWCQREPLPWRWCQDVQNLLQVQPGCSASARAKLRCLITWFLQTGVGVCVLKELNVANCRALRTTAACLQCRAIRTPECYFDLMEAR
jgi:hypothetical protein